MENLYIVSRCLLGVNCKYNGGNNYSPAVVKFTEKHRCIDVCPETAGGLPAPRPPAEQIFCDGECRVINRESEDVTAEFVHGAIESLRAVKEYASANDLTIAGAILKARSPSCGSSEVYDGTFSGRTTAGDGVFAAMLKSGEIAVANEDNYKEIFDD